MVESNDKSPGLLERGEDLRRIPPEGKVGRSAIGIHGTPADVAAFHGTSERGDAKRTRAQVGLRGRLLSSTARWGWGRRERAQTLKPKRVGETSIDKRQ
jgi:hypothetical protein